MTQLIGMPDTAAPLFDATLNDDQAQAAYDKFMDCIHNLYVESLAPGFCGFVIEEQRETGSNRLMAARLIACDDVAGVQARRVA